MRLTNGHRIKRFSIMALALLPMAATGEVTDTIKASAAAASSQGPNASRGQERYPTMAPLEQYLMPDRDAEIALARSAAPAAISSDAAVLVLTRRGYEAAVDGRNGFVCMVDRAWQAPFADPEFWNPKVRSPVCLNPQAARSVLPIGLKRTELALAGSSKADIMARIKAAIGTKDLGLPDIGAMSYMMSPYQYLGDEFRHWQPHLMFYVPSTIGGGDWGANLSGSPVMVGPERLPDGGREPVVIFVVPVGRWSDGTPAPVDHQPSSR